MAKNPDQPDDIDEAPSILGRLGRWLSTKRQTMNEEEQKGNVPATEVASPETNKPEGVSAEEGAPKPRRSSRSGAARRRRRSSAAKKKATEGVSANGAANALEAGGAAESGGEQAKKDSEPQATEKKPSSRGRRGRGGRGRSQSARANEPAVEVEEKESAGSAATRKLLINSEEPEECRVVLLENGKVESFHIETMVLAQQKGNIYKGKIAAVEPNLQAAFVEIGTGKNGFLPFGDIHPEYYCKEVDPGTHWKDLNIQDVVRKGTEVLVEVVKEATGNKGANMTTFLSLPGRYLVLMPGSDSAGISRKIDNEEQRRSLRETMNSLKIPEGIGYIVRTASNEITKTALSQDLKYLLNLWNEIKSRGMRAFSFFDL
ncbi:MAG: ribonuclease E/G [Desulfobulbaceae bacterium]|nr:ribonuclease E/G [Desulfobulbaceae bacterium]